MVGDTTSDAAVATLFNYKEGELTRTVRASRTPAAFEAVHRPFIGRSQAVHRPFIGHSRSGISPPPLRFCRRRDLSRS